MRWHGCDRLAGSGAGGRCRTRRLRPAALAGTMGPRPAPAGLIVSLLKRHGANERRRVRRSVCLGYTSSVFIAPLTGSTTRVRGEFIRTGNLVRPRAVRAGGLGRHGRPRGYRQIAGNGGGAFRCPVRRGTDSTKRTNATRLRSRRGPCACRPLRPFVWTTIVRHRLVMGTASPDDPALDQYRADRRRKTYSLLGGITASHASDRFFEP